MMHRKKQGCKDLNGQRSANAALMMPKRHRNHGGGKSDKGGHRGDHHGIPLIHLLKVHTPCVTQL